MISPKIKIAIVRIPVTTPAPIDWKYSIASVVAREDAERLTILLPIRIALSILLGFSMSFDTIIARFDFSSVKARIRSLFTVVNAVSADEKFLSKMVEFIDKHMSDSDFNVNALADMMATSPKQLYRKVKALTGQTPVEYISGIRMKKAAMLLSQGSFTVAEVMYMVGFSNHSYFAKCFASSYGMTPKQYISKSNLSDTSTQIVEE